MIENEEEVIEQICSQWGWAILGDDKLIDITTVYYTEPDELCIIGFYFGTNKIISITIKDINTLLAEFPNGDFPRIDAHVEPIHDLSKNEYDYVGPFKFTNDIKFSVDDNGNTVLDEQNT